MEWIDELKELRKQIDSIDEEILILLNKRVRLCIEIAKVKKKANLQLEDQKREHEILQKVGTFKPIFEEIIKLCKNIEKTIIKEGTA